VLIGLAEPGDEGPVASKASPRSEVECASAEAVQQVLSGATGTPSPLAASSARR
jgi:hypothetical protein